MQLSRSLRLVILIELMVPITLLILGIYHGLMQTLYRSGILHKTAFAGLDYYQGLTLHGVINAVVLTTFFGVAFGSATVAFYLKKEGNRMLHWLSLILMVIGTLMAAGAMLSGKASVLYTFYPPLKAHWTFYAGAALLIVGSWVPLFNWTGVYLQWRRENPTTKLPIAVLGTLVNFITWFVCTLAVAYEVLVLLLPWSLGWTETVNVPLARTLFWFFGHALVYFWLLPAYIMFYAILPKLAGGKLYSDTAGRIAFWLFLIFSIPVGVHHQFSEPSLTQGTKFFQSLLTFGVGIPSFITAFTIAASLEYAGRRRGARGWFGWMGKLPFLDKENFMFAYLICGLIIFIFGGLTGIVNASYNLNAMVHNTAWMPGHFHMTVAGPVFLAIIGMSLYLLSKLTGKPVKSARLNVMVPYLWIIGMLLFSSGLMWGGLHGEPRRTDMGMSYLNPDSPLYRPDWIASTTLAVVGGIIMTIGGLFYFIAFFRTAFGKRTVEPSLDLPVSEPLHEEKRYYLLEKFAPWMAVMVVVIFLAYVPALRDVLKYTGKGAPPYQPSNPVPELKETAPAPQ